MENWRTVRLAENAELLRKEWYEYRLETDIYDIELFETRDGRFYAVGTPSDKTRLFIYGSAVVNDPRTAIEQALRKINRDHNPDHDWTIGEDARLDGDED